MKEALDDFLGSFFEYAGDLRGLYEELQSSVSIGEAQGPGMLVQMTLALVESNVQKQACASCFFYPDDADLLFDESVEDLLCEREASEMGEDSENQEGQEGQDGQDGEDGVQGPQTGGAVGGFTYDVDMDFAGAQVMGVVASEGTQPTNSIAGVDEGRAPVQLASKPPSSGKTPETSSRVERTSSHSTDVESAHGKRDYVRHLSSILDPEDHRYVKIMQWRESIMECKRAHTHSHESWSQIPRMAFMSLKLHNPISMVFSRSISMSHSIRALLFACEFLGGAMLTTLFTSASGGSGGKRSPKGCADSCQENAVEQGEETVPYCVLFLAGRIIAIGTASAIVASIPVMLIGSLHSRKFRVLDYEGSRTWKRQMRKWRRLDRILWVVGLLYCAFATQFTVLFFANVSAEDQEDWFAGATIGFAEDFMVLPFISGFFLALMSLMLLAFLGLRFGVNRSSLVKHGDVSYLRDLFDYTTDKEHIHDALHKHPDPRSFIENHKSSESRVFSTAAESEPSSGNLNVALRITGKDGHDSAETEAPRSPNAGGGHAEHLEELCEASSLQIDGMMPALDQEVHLMTMSSSDVLSPHMVSSGAPMLGSFRASGMMPAVDQEVHLITITSSDALSPQIVSSSAPRLRSFRATLV